MMLTTQTLTLPVLIETLFFRFFSQDHDEVHLCWGSCGF
ncbi:hypothetical protein DSL72_006236 [Monilinia vaccinii-corymbosi]|uniref:Uncharacterized protein n=1 Tax=Monilinia vaccinii-corymbosi TaxID=61207 RepID=A0A8A3PMJ7_9HELO|nr:hypothetical protein DSL72_006236 [Monilinia vaccinii-corymbosi]